jgi:hypothetical protein
MPQSAPSIWTVCREGFRRNRVPAIVLQAFAGGLLLLYFLVSPAREAFQVIGRLKADTGPAFAFISTAVFGGFLPWLVLWRRGRVDGRPLAHLLFLVLFWGVQGMIVDLLYTLQDQAFGSGRDWKTLAIKTLIDQGPFNLFWGTPNSLVFYGWKNAGFSWRRFARGLTRQRVLHRYVSIQVSGWITWIPAVLMIYSLPPDLQVPLFNLVLCFFSLLLAFVSREG